MSDEADKIGLTPHLKHDSSRMRGYISDSYPGMAHWAGTGPKNATCRQCVHWAHVGWYSGFSENLKPAPCRKYKAFMGRKGKPVPHQAKACRYFEKNNSPPTLRPSVKRG